MAPTQITAPTTELGAPQAGLQNLGGGRWSTPVIDDRERKRALTWPVSVRETYPDMLNDAHIDGMYRGLLYPIRAYHWYLQPNSAPQTALDRISQDYGLPVGEDGEIDQRRAKRRFIFSDHLEDALRGPAYGHYFFEQVFEVLEDGPASLNDGWVAHLRKLAARPPHTLLQIVPADDGGLDHIEVPARRPANSAGMMSRTGVDIPVNRLVAYVWDREGANWRGRSMLRSLYDPWRLKRAVMQVGAINIERAGGVPYIEAPEGAGTTEMAELHQLAAHFRVGENAGAALPHGAVLKFAQAAGGDQAVNFVRLQNEEMARAWVQMIQVAAETGNGSRALGQTFADRADLVQHAIAVWFRDLFQRHVIEDDVEHNEGEQAEYAPLLRFKPAGDPVEQLATSLEDAQSQGALPANSQAAAAVRGDRAPASRAAAMRAPQRHRHAPVTAATGDGARGLTDAEQASGADFEALQASYLAAVNRLRRQWDDVTAAQIDELAAQIQATTTVEGLAALTATTAGADVLIAELDQVLQDGAAAAVSEAAAQGATLDADLSAARTALEHHAHATAALLARALSQSAASHAVSIAGDQPDMAAVATSVREHLEGLSGATVDYELAGAVSRAQNHGRFAVMDQAPDGTRFYASELNDTNTCTLCSEVDGQEYDSMAEVRRDYPAGGYVGCQGGNRCRGTAVMVLPEST